MFGINRVKENVPIRDRNSIPCKAKCQFVYRRRDIKT